MASDSDPKSPPLQDGRFTSLRSSHMDPVFNLKLDGVGVDCAPPGQYPSSSTTPRSESPSVLFTFLYWVILGTRLGSSSRREVETQSNLQVCDRYNARLAKLLVLQGIVLLSAALFSAVLPSTCRWTDCTEQESIRLLSFSMAISLSGQLLQIGFLCTSSENFLNGFRHAGPSLQEMYRRELLLVLSLPYLLFIAAVIFLFCGVTHIFLSLL